MFSKKAPKTRITKVKGALRTSAIDSSVTKLDDWAQVRRCHRCGATHEQLGARVLKCDCGAHFAPYLYSELTPDALAIGTPESLVLSSAKNFRPLIGITWWWHD